MSGRFGSGLALIGVCVGVRQRLMNGMKVGWGHFGEEVEVEAMGRRESEI